LQKIKYTVKMSVWVEFLVTYDETEAQIVKDILDAEDIPVVVNSLKIRPYPVNIGRMGEVRLLVREEDVKKAASILEIMKDTSSEKEAQ
jgi:uncharacterized secreted protein with C-terminal beta-propeller domain